MMASSVTNFEIPADDVKETMSFYISDFGWESHKFGEMNYWLVKTGPEGEAGITGGLIQRTDPSQNIFGIHQTDENAGA